MCFRSTRANLVNDPDQPFNLGEYKMMAFKGFSNEIEVIEVLSA